MAPVLVGVTTSPQGRWCARLGIRPNHRIHLGTYDTQAQAEAAFDVAALAVFGKLARTNEPASSYTLAAVSAAAARIGLPLHPSWQDPRALDRKYKGVRELKSGYQPTVSKGKQRFVLGTYGDPLTAATMYDLGTVGMLGVSQSTKRTNWPCAIYGKHEHWVTDILLLGELTGLPVHKSWRLKAKRLAAKKQQLAQAQEEEEEAEEEGEPVDSRAQQAQPQAQQPQQPQQAPPRAQQQAQVQPQPAAAWPKKKAATSASAAAPTPAPAAAAPSQTASKKRKQQPDRAPQSQQQQQAVQQAEPPPEPQPKRRKGSGSASSSAAASSPSQPEAAPPAEEDVYAGIVRRKRKHKRPWRASAQHAGLTYPLGTFREREDAEEAVDMALFAMAGPTHRKPGQDHKFVGYSVHELASHAQEHALPLHPSLAEVLKPAAKKGGRKRRREEQPKAQPPPKAQPKQQQQSRAQPPPAAQPAPVVQLKRKRQPKQQQPAPAVQPKKKRQPKQQPPPQPPAAEPVCMLIETTAAKRATKRVWQKYFHMPFCTM